MSTSPMHSMDKFRSMVTRALQLSELMRLWERAWEKWEAIYYQAALGRALHHESQQRKVTRVGIQ